jgi:peptide/nickel transport system permease protein
VLTYIVRRFLASLLVIFVVLTGSFFLIRLLPGNPAQLLQQQLLQEGGLTPQEIQSQLKIYYTILPHGPLLSQYVQYLGNVAHGNLGRSLTDPTHTVAQVINGALPWTILLGAVSLLVAFVIGILVGTIMAVFRKGVVAQVLTVATSFFSSIPVYVVALILIWQVAGVHHLFPTQGAYDPDVAAGFNWPFIANVADHLVLPVAANVITGFGGWALMMKGSAATTLGADYIRASESWGLTRRRITQTYIGRNSMLPIVTNLALALGSMLGGAVFVETFFTYPGIGYYLVEAIGNRDYPVMMGCFILLTTATVLANFLVDVLYPLIDPRIARPGGASRAAERRREAVAERAAAQTGAMTAQSGGPS